MKEKEFQVIFFEKWLVWGEAPGKCILKVGSGRVNVQLGLRITDLVGRTFNWSLSDFNSSLGSV